MSAVFQKIRVRNQGGTTAAPGGAAPSPFDQSPPFDVDDGGFDAAGKIKRGRRADMRAAAVQRARDEIDKALPRKLSDEGALAVDAWVQKEFDRLGDQRPEHEKWQEAMERAIVWLPKRFKPKPEEFEKGAPAGDLRKKDDSRSYWEPVRLGATVGQNIASTAAYTLADHFMPPAVRLGGIGRRLAFRLGASAAGGAAGGAGGEALGRQAYGPGRAPQSWTPPNRSVGEEAARAGGSWLGEAVGASMKGGIARKILVGSAVSLAGEEAAASGYKAAKPRVTSATRTWRERRAARAAAAAAQAAP
jgi:hypothetical protein